MFRVYLLADESGFWDASQGLACALQAVEGVNSEMVAARPVSPWLWKSLQGPAYVGETTALRAAEDDHGLGEWARLHAKGERRLPWRRALLEERRRVGEELRTACPLSDPTAAAIVASAPPLAARVAAQAGGSLDTARLWTTLCCRAFLRDRTEHWLTVRTALLFTAAHAAPERIPAWLTTHALGITLGFHLPSPSPLSARTSQRTPWTTDGPSWTPRTPGSSPRCSARGPTCGRAWPSWRTWLASRRVGGSAGPGLLASALCAVRARGSRTSRPLLLTARSSQVMAWDARHEALLETLAEFDASGGAVGAGGSRLARLRTFAVSRVARALRLGHETLSVFFGFDDEPLPKQCRAAVLISALMAVLCVDVWLYYVRGTNCCQEVRVLLGCEPEVTAECLGFVGNCGEKKTSKSSVKCARRSKSPIVRRR